MTHILQTAGLALESIDLCFAPWVNPVKEAKRIRAAIKPRDADGLSLVDPVKGHQEELEMALVVAAGNKH